MSFKKLLVPVNGGARDAVVLRTALAVAKTFDAHVTALFVHADMREAIPFGELPLSPDFVQDLIATTAQVEKAASAAARQHFAEAVAQTGAATVEHAEIGFSATFAEATGDLSRTIGRASRLCDLAVFPSLSENDTRDMTEAFAHVLVKTACSVLLLPVQPPQTVGRTIAVGWDEEARCARALMAALPFLRRAARVVLLCVRPEALSECNVAEAVGYLGLHGVAAESRVVAQGARKVGEVLLETAVEGGFDLLVAGGYGRGRLTEALFGGVTEHMVSHTPLPVFLAH